MKLELMQRHSILKIKDASFNCTGGSFLIKEVRSVKGKGKGIPQSLRAFARILCCASPEELNDLELKATQTDGRLARCPLTKGNREMQAHKILLSHIIEVIEKYDASIKSLSYMSKPQEDADKFIHRRKMAEYLLSGEVRVLRSASAWLHNYCSALKKGIMF